MKFSRSNRVHVCLKWKSFSGCNESGADKSDITYDLIWQSDSVRLSNQSTVYGFGLHPVTEAGAALIFSDGKIILWELVNTRVCS